MWDALNDHLIGRTGWDAEKERSQKWAEAPADFSYPWGYEWWTRKPWPGESNSVRPRTRATYKRRRLRAADLRALNRIISKRKPEPVHPDQLYLF